MAYKDQYQMYADMVALTSAGEKLSWLQEQVENDEFVKKYALELYQDQIKGDNVRALIDKITPDAETKLQLGRYTLG